MNEAMLERREAEDEVYWLIRLLFYPVRRLFDSDRGALDRIENSVVKYFRQRVAELAADGSRDYDVIFERIKKLDILSDGAGLANLDLPNVGFDFWS